MKKLILIVLLAIKILFAETDFIEQGKDLIQQGGYDSAIRCFKKALD